MILLLKFKYKLIISEQQEQPEAEEDQEIPLVNKQQRKQRPPDATSAPRPKLTPVPRPKATVASSTSAPQKNPKPPNTIHKPAIPPPAPTSKPAPKRPRSQPAESPPPPEKRPRVFPYFSFFLIYFF